LTADQVSALTCGIVWMESQQVKLPDGSIDTVLVPKVCLAHVGNGAVTHERRAHHRRRRLHQYRPGHPQPGRRHPQR
jgi:hypothetical protein